MYTPTQAQAQAQAHAHIQLIIRHNDELSDSLYIFFSPPDHYEWGQSNVFCANCQPYEQTIKQMTEIKHTHTHTEREKKAESERERMKKSTSQRLYVWHKLLNLIKYKHIHHVYADFNKFGNETKRNEKKQLKTILILLYSISLLLLLSLLLF